MPQMEADLLAGELMGEYVYVHSTVAVHICIYSTVAVHICIHSNVVVHICSSTVAVHICTSSVAVHICTFYSLVLQAYVYDATCIAGICI